MLINSPNISGSLTVTGNAVITGSLTVLGGINATITGSVTTASYVEYSNVANKPTLVSGSSQITYSGLTGVPSGIVSGSSQITYSGLSGIPSGIVSSSAQVTGFGIFATTGSNQFNGSQAITGSLTVTGQVVAQTLNVQQVTSSIVYSSGSNIFGNTLGNTQQFTGSVSVTGSLTVNGVNYLPLTGGTLTGALSGTSATFSGLVTTNDNLRALQTTTSANSQIIADSDNGSTLRAAIITFGSTASDSLLGILRASNSMLYKDGGKLAIGTRSAQDLVLSTNDTIRLTISSTGVATFSNTVTATGNVRSINTGVDGTFADAFVGVLSTNNNETNAIQTSVSSAANVSGFRFQASNGGGSAGRTTVVDFLRDRQLFYTNVGIGTTTPGTRLEVSSTAPIGDRTLPHNILTLTAEQGNAPYGGFGGAILFKNRSYISGLVESSRIRSVIYDDGAPNNFGGGLWFETTPTPGGTLTPSVIINYQGRVGIGNSSPVQKLHVEGSAAIGTTGTEDILLLGRALSGGVSFQQAASLKLGRYQNAGGAFESYTRLDFALRDNSASSNYNTNTTVMTLTNAGNVGIGTTSPEALLHLSQASTGGNGAFIFVDNPASSTLGNTAGIRFATNAGASFSGYGSSIEAVNTNAGDGAEALTFSTWNGASRGERMRITSGGEVGIGVTPTSGNRFWVRGGSTSSSDTSLFIQNSTPSSLFLVRNDGLVGFPKINDFTTGNSPNTWINPASSYGIYINTSSRRYKKDISNYDKGISIVNQLRPVYYKGISEVDGDKQFVGLIAEEIHDLGLTEFVNYNEEGDPNSLSYPNMIALAFKAIQEQQSQIESLKTKIEILEQS